MLDAPNGHGSRHGQEALAGLQMMKSKSKRKSKQTNKQMKKINNKAKEKIIILRLHAGVRKLSGATEKAIRLRRFITEFFSIFFFTSLF